MSTTEYLQFAAWLVALIAFDVGLYVMVVNSKQIANRYVSVLLMLLSVHIFAVGTITGAAGIEQAGLASALLAATTTAILPAITLTSIALIKPSAFSSRWGWLGWIPRILAVIPAVLTVYDLIFGTQLWYTGLNPATYKGGILPLDTLTMGTLQTPIIIINIAGFAILSIGILIYLSFFDPSIETRIKYQSWLLLATVAIAGIFSTSLTGVLNEAAGNLLSDAILVAGFSFVIFQQLAHQRQTQYGSLQTRMTTLMMVVTLPIVTAMALLLIRFAQTQIQQDALNRLTTTNHSVADATSAWLGSNINSLENLTINDNIISMQAERQKPLLENLVSVYNHMYLVSTTDLRGVNVSRSDDGELQDYSDMHWFQMAIGGDPVNYQTLIDRTSGQPAVVVSMPIQNNAGVIIGVTMFVSDLDELTHIVEHAEAGPGSKVYIVDENNQLIVHDENTPITELNDMSSAPPVQALRDHSRGISNFEDLAGDKWVAYVDDLENGWGVIVQQKESELLAPVRSFQRLAFGVVVLAAGLLFLLAAYTVRQSIQPISTLTATAERIIAGDLSQTAPIESNDEIGLLARTFNQMTEQLRALISNLENRVDERTADVERRALQLQVTAEVARDAAAIREQEELLDHVVKLISDRFGFYHCGIFLLSERIEVDETKSLLPARGYAVLRAASSEGGQRMLARGHRLKTGGEGIVGYAARSGMARMALDVGADAIFFDNPDLPLTRSELALPLKVQDQVIGVLDVQSLEPDAFNDEDIAILQILADQLALAIDNTRLLEESQQALLKLEASIRKQVREDWEGRLQGEAITYVWNTTGIRPANELPESYETRYLQLDPSQSSNQNGYKTVKLPIQLRGQRLGTLVLRRQPDQEAWTKEEREIIQQTITQIALALENARLVEETQKRADRERLLGQVSGEVRKSMEVDSVLRTAIEEIYNIFDLEDLVIQLEPTNDSANFDQMNAPDRDETNENTNLKLGNNRTEKPL